jgi:hypothetical protein
MYDMCCANPQMLLQLMQTDKRWGVVLQELTGIDFDAMKSNEKDNDEQDEKNYEETMAQKA